jgi:hypothetical protein
VGTIDQLMAKQEIAKQYLAGLQHMPDPPARIAAAVNQKSYNQDVIINLALIHQEMYNNSKGVSKRDINYMDFIWAVDLLDYIGVFGLVIYPGEVENEAGEAQ